MDRGAWWSNSPLVAKSHTHSQFGQLWGEWVHVYVGLSPFAIHMKLSHCQLAIVKVKSFQARVLEWVAIYFPQGIFPTLDRTFISCIADRCFTI